MVEIVNQKLSGKPGAVQICILEGVASLRFGHSSR